jgi:predicted PhzF superfamily epimerase YddE/YHI9
MRIPYFQIDAFTAQTFGGNPAGVCVLKEWLSDETLQQIGAENNLSETAFFVREKDFFQLRWFTPTMEVDLCGHATVAAAFVLFSELSHVEPVIRFHSRSGWLNVRRDKEILLLDFPSRPALPCPAPELLARALGRKPSAVLKSRDYLAVFESENEVAEIAPDMQLLMELDCLGIIVTAPGNKADFVSRFFAPRAGIPEDPVTGSAHCSLIPYWADRLGKPELFARQISKRGGELHCRNAGERVEIGGRAAVYARGELDIPDFE